MLLSTCLKYMYKLIMAHGASSVGQFLQLHFLLNKQFLLLTNLIAYDAFAILISMY